MQLVITTALSTLTTALSVEKKNLFGNSKAQNFDEISKEEPNELFVKHYLNVN